MEKRNEKGSIERRRSKGRREKILGRRKGWDGQDVKEGKEGKYGTEGKEGE